MQFDQNYLDLPEVVAKVAARDAYLRGREVDPEEFALWAREQFTENECGTDEYGETQPGKGLSFIADFLADRAPGEEAVEEMIGLTLQWLTAVRMDGFSRYAGADFLVPIMNHVFDWEWAKGGHPYHRSWEDYLDGSEGAVEWYNEDKEAAS